MAHKMIRCSRKIIGRRYDKLLFILNIPSLTAACVLLVISQIIIRNMNVPSDFYRIFFTVLYVSVMYAFVTVLVVTAAANRSLRGHGIYTYMEILGEHMIVSEYTGSSYSPEGITDFIRLWVVKLADVEQVTCTERKIIIKTKARLIEERADRLTYSADSQGRAEFDYWWYNSGGGTPTDTVEIRDNYFYAESAARRIIFCSEKQKARELSREEFRRRMLEIAAGKRKPDRRRRKKEERVFRGYDIERKF